MTAEREEVVVDLTAAEEEVTVDLTAAEEEVTVDLTAGEEDPWVPSKPSRYMSRSAGLPRIGESASSVLGDMQKVRKKEGT
ncbi:MAG: hypothetical protein EHM57_00715 [Actinobacteria bacterium]|nr:MAG: hypothetical protein EHM57_00715 [Actinomycetota bacterium]